MPWGTTWEATAKLWNCRHRRGRAHTDQQSFILQPAQIGVRDARRIEIARTDDAACFCNGKFDIQNNVDSVGLFMFIILALIK